MIITTDEKTARWRADPRVQARAPISDPMVLSRAGGVRRGAVRGTDLCGAYARGRGRWRGARRSPRQEGCSGSREGGLADWGGLSWTQLGGAGVGVGCGNQEIPLPIGCQGQAPPFRDPAQRPRGWAQTKAPGRPCPLGAEGGVLRLFAPLWELGSPCPS